MIIWVKVFKNGPRMDQYLIIFDRNNYHIVKTLYYWSQGKAFPVIWNLFARHKNLFSSSKHAKNSEAISYKWKIYICSWKIMLASVTALQQDQ